MAGIVQDNRIEKLKNAAKNGSNQQAEKIKNLSEEFESMLMYQAMKTMRDTVPKNGYFHSSAEEIFTSMLDQEITKSSAKRGNGLGLARIMQQQLTNRGNQTLESRGLARPGSESKKKYQAVFPNNR